MKKILAYLKKNYLLSIILIAILLIIVIVLIVWGRRGTFGLDDDANRLEIVCPEQIDSLEGVSCAVKLYYDTAVYTGDKKILSVNANFNFPTTVTDVSFVSACNDCDVSEVTENGFAIGKLAGLDNSATIGTITLTLPSGDDSYTLRLINVELSDSDFEMIELNDAITTISFGSDPGGEEPSSYDITFDSSISVDENNKVIYGVSDLYTFQDLSNKITTDGVMKITDTDNRTYLLTDKVKTGVLIEYVWYSYGSGVDPSDPNDLLHQVTYTLSVLGDYDGNGQIKPNDVKMLYDLYKSLSSSDPPSVPNIDIYTGDMDGNGQIKPNDVKMLYDLYKVRSSNS